jgi:hypothetical protein
VVIAGREGSNNEVLGVKRGWSISYAKGCTKYLHKLKCATIILEDNEPFPSVGVPVGSCTLLKANFDNLPGFALS